MRNSSIVLRELKEQISGFEKLKIIKAQELYKKAISTSDTKLKKLYMDKLVLGTLYVIYDYIERNQINLFSSAVYGVEDIISSFIETWIEKMYNGDIVNVDKFSLILNISFFNEVYNKLGGQEIVVNDLYSLPTEQFIKLFLKYIESKNVGRELTQDDIIRYFWGDDYKKYLKYGSVFYDVDLNIIKLFEGIYKNLELDKIDDLELNKTKIYGFLKIILSAGLIDSISDDYVDSYDMEDNIVNKIFFEKFNDYVDNTIEQERTKDIIHKRYGLDDGHPQTLEQIGKTYKISRDRVRQIEAKAIRKLRGNSNIRKYLRGI